MRDLPTGVVTFLLTDIEGSTPAWESDAVAMGAAVAHHDRILSAAAAHFDGVRPVEQGEGDSMVLGFRHATDALAAALAAQKALQAELGERCRVRMAVHSGEALVRLDVDTSSERYAGRSIIAAARLRSAAHGGQVLVSSTTAALAANSLTDGLWLIPLGAVSLRGLTNPEEVFQLAHADLPSNFPALRELVTCPNSIPSPTASFVGRQLDLEQLVTLTGAQRLVTITGTGGVGKTCLAQHLAMDIVDQSPGGVWWVEFAPATTSEGVLAAMADGMHLELAPGLPALTQFIRHLDDSAVVTLVLDNCEHVVELVGDIAVQLLEALPALHVVTTSREPLGLTGEHVWRVSSLAVPPVDRRLDAEELFTFDAARLFIERARAARPNLTVDGSVTQHIAAICTRLDGVPLAIELAAARSRAMPLDALARGLDDAFRILTGGPRTLLPRQQTLLASIAWSVDLLPTTEQLVLGRLAICPASFDLDAAEAIAADGVEVQPYAVLDALISLVDKSLVDFDDSSGTYRMLETIRQFALDRLHGSKDVMATRRRHAAYWADRTVAVEVWQTNATALSAQLADIFAMLDWAMVEDPAMAERVLAGAGTLYGFGRWEALPRGVAFLMADRERTSHWPMAVGILCTIAPLAGQFQIFGVLAEAIAAATAADDDAAVRILSLGEAYVGLMQADPRFAVALFDEAVAVGHTDAAFMAGTGATSILAWIGQEAEAQRIADWVLNLLDAGGGVSETAAGSTIAFLNNSRGVFNDSDDIPERVNSWGMVSNQYAEVAAVRAVYTGQLIWQQRALRLCSSDIGLLEGLTRRRVTWAGAVVNGDLESALEALGDDSSHDMLAVLPFDLLRGATQAALGRWADAHITTELAEAGAHRIPVPAPFPHAAATLLRARVAAANGDLPMADAKAHEALATAFDASLRVTTIDALETVAAVTHDRIRAARLAGAASADRLRCGYVARLWSGLTESDAGLLQAEHPDGWAEGEALTMTDAVGIARKQRGPRGRPEFGIASLTPTEALVAEALARGRTNPEVAAELLISVATVKTHVTRIFVKLNVRNRSELVNVMHQQK